MWLGDSSKTFALAASIAITLAGCTRPDAQASSAPAAPSTASPPPALPSKKACGAAHLVVAGDTPAAIASVCYGARAYAGLLERKNGLEGSTLPLGKSIATPPLRDLVRCAPADVCDPIYEAHSDFLAAQALTEAGAEKSAPPAARPSLDSAESNLRLALEAAAGKSITRPKRQLESAIGEIASLRSGSYAEHGYPEQTFHQHLVFALEALRDGS